MEKHDVHVLIVEDEEIIRVMFQQSFENWGFQVDTAENGKEGLEKCQEKNYHIVATDLNMPVMTGMELLKKVKSKWPFIEVIVITGFATIESAIEAMKAGAYDFILKPVNFDHVQFTIDKCFQKIKRQAENTELRQLNAQLMELNEMKDKFLYITNHEMRTPLTIVKGYLDVLHNLMPEENEDLTEILEILNNTVNEMNDIVERMHMLEGLDQSEIADKSHAVDLKKLMSKVYKEMVGLYNTRNIDLKVLLDKKPMVLKGDYRQLRLVLREFMQNALKFTNDGGKVRVQLELKNKEIHYSVKDNGVGIPLEKQELIFERFYEIQDVINHRTSKQEFMGGGMGIGLSLVKNIVDSMDGKIFVDSNKNEGSLFKVILPYSPIEEGEKENVLQDASHKT